MTIFIGGNQEAWNYLQELPFGGWVSPNIYYLGYAGVVNYRGLRIGGVSGVHSPRHYHLDHFERSPYTEDTARSVYHYREQDFKRLMQICEPIDIVISHEWPQGVTKYGNTRQMENRRFGGRIENVGVRQCFQLLDTLQPSYWFAAQMKIKFAALIPHEHRKNTKFLALESYRYDTLKDGPLDDNFFAVVDFKTNSAGLAINEETHMRHDLEWLAILHHSAQSDNPSEYQYNDEVKEVVLQKFNGDLTIPNNFERTTHAYDPNDGLMQDGQKPNAFKNPQNVRFCDLLDIMDPMDN